MARQTFQNLKRTSCIEQEACTEDAARPKGETARKAFEVYVSTAEWAVKKAEDVLLSSAKSLSSK